MTPLAKPRSLAKPDADPRVLTANLAKPEADKRTLTAKPRSLAMRKTGRMTPLRKRRIGGLL